MVIFSCHCECVIFTNYSGWFFCFHFQSRSLCILINYFNWDIDKLTASVWVTNKGLSRIISDTICFRNRNCFNSVTRWKRLSAFPMCNVLAKILSCNLMTLLNSQKIPYRRIFFTLCLTEFWTHSSHYIRLLSFRSQTSFSSYSYNSTFISFVLCNRTL